MNLKPTTLGAILVLVFLTGNLSGILVAGFDTENGPASERVTTGAAAHLPEYGADPAIEASFGKPPSPETVPTREAALAPIGAESSDLQNQPEAEESITARWEKLYPDQPPPDAPHLSDEYFFGPDPSDPETQRLRQEALDDHIASLRQAGLPEEDVQALLDEHESELSTLNAPQPEIDAYPPAPEILEADLVHSLIEAGETQETITTMTQELRAGIERNNDPLSASQQPLNPEGPNGLDHPE